MNMLIIFIIINILIHSENINILLSISLIKYISKN